MSSVLYRKWRSRSFAEVVGQEHVTRTLLNALSSGRVAHAYLFCGPRGTGKTSTARILAKAVNCLEGGKGEPCNQCAMCQAINEGRALDLIEIDAASNRRIDEIRDLRDKVNFAPNEARFKFYIIDEVHMLTREAFNALLKTLEEPPAHTIFVLATTEAHQVPSTIISRCQRFDFRRIPLTDMVNKLTHICREEGIAAEPDALELVAKRATGSLRDAENMLEQLHAHYGGTITLTQVQELLGLASDLRVQELARLIIRKDVPKGLATINALCDDGADLRQFARQLVDYLRQLLILQMEAGQILDLPQDARQEMHSLAAEATPQDLLRAIRLFGQADTRLEGLNSLPLELALVEYSLHSEREGREVPQRANATEEKAHHSQAKPKQPEPIAPSLDITSGDPIEQLSRNWPRILAEVRPVNKSIEAVLRNSCKVVAMEEDTVVLGFYWDFHKDKVEDPRNRRVVEGILSRIMGRHCQIQCILTPKEPKAASKATAPQEDPLVQVAVQEYGARIVGPPSGRSSESEEE
jgi:DNA polymerase-3 subunit gamma/tau